jgi:class 3 adenylate cyclase
MPSERVQRRIDRLLDQAEAAADSRKWAEVQELAREVLLLDEDNSDAASLLRVAEGMDSSPGSVLSESPRAASAHTTSPAAGSAETLPTSFVSGRYEVQAFLGEGGRKRVYRARDTRLDRDVAFALIRTEGLDADGRQRIQREAQAMARLSHPNVVTIFDIGEEEDGRPYIVSEYMAGGDVEGLLREAEDHCLPIERTVAIADAVAQALAHAHSHDIVHRDLKPANIWLAADGTAQLGDFGLALAVQETRMTTEGTMLGTVAYMAPEQGLGRAVTAAADLYALGCVLYELVTGRPPFVGDDAVAVISQHLNTAPVAPSWHRDDCPPDLERLILDLLLKAPDDRPASADAVQERLDGIDLAVPVAPAEHANPLERLARGVFVGREAELQRLRAAFDEAQSGRGSVVMLVGEPGIGKTRTALELETYARMRGAQVIWGRAHERAGAPAYWPWIQAGRAVTAAMDPALAASLIRSSAVELQRLYPEIRDGLPDLPPPPAMDDSEAAQFRLFDALTTFFRQVAERTPLVLVLDDLQWADKPSLLLLQHLAGELARSRILVVGTYRDTELSRTHPLSETLATLNREAGFQRLLLRGLSQDDVAVYIRQTANLDPARQLLETIFRETEGNPFFLQEVIALMVQEGTLVSGRASMSVPEGVREALGRRLDRLTDEANALLTTAAVVGREFPYDTLSLLSDADDDALLRRIEEALAARVIEEMDQPGRYQFTHALMQETLLDELSTTRRVRLHGQIGDALERSWGERTDERASRLAQHFVESATLTQAHAVKAVHYSKLAAEQAEAQSAWAEAARHYDNAASLVSEAPDGLGEDEAALLLALGRAARSGGNQRAAWRSLMRAIGVFRERGEPAGVARATLEAMQIIAPPQRLLALADQALEELDEADPRLTALLLARMLGDLALREFIAGRRPQLERDARRIVDQHDLRDVGALLLTAEAYCAVDDGRPIEAIPLGQEAHATFLELGMLHDAADTLLAIAIWRVISGDLKRGRNELEQAVHFAREHRLRFFEESATQMLAEQWLKTGDFSRFDELAEDLLRSEAYIGPLSVAKRTMLAGDAARSVALLPAEDSTGRAPGLLAAWHGGRARVLFHAGDLDAARTEWQRWVGALEQLRPSAAVALPLPGRAAADAVDVTVALADDVLARQIFEHLTARPEVRCYPNDVSIDHVRGNLALRFGEIDQAERWYRTGLAWSEREGAVIETGRCLQGLAELASRRGDGAEAVRHLDRAIAVYEQFSIGLHLKHAVARKLELQGLADVDVYASIYRVAASVATTRPDLSSQAAPDGTVTLLFSDIEESTALTERLGDAAWMELLRAHNGIVREQIAACNGYEVKSMGDGFMLAFRSATDGLRCAIGMQQAFAQHNAEAAQPVNVRIGLHTGEAVKEANDFFGTHVNLAARIGGAAAGGEILVSGLLKELAATAGKFRFDAGEEVELKGLQAAQRVHRVEWR